MEKISADHVRATVRGYWDALAKKSKQKLADFYAPDAIVFMADTKRNEPAKLMIERRNREFFDAQGSASAQLGEIDVHIPGPHVAIATYSYHFSAIRIRNNNRVRIDMPNTRATQVFRLEPDGVLHLVHEHLSASKYPTITVLGPEDKPPTQSAST
jgi:ketosteroid isomerase-like protein